MTEKAHNGISVYYDGECPFCRSYIAYAELRRRFGHINLIDARQAPDKVAALLAAGFDLDEGFVVEFDGKFHSGGDAMWYIHSTLTPDDKMISHLTNRRALNFFYPALKFGRNLALRFLGKKKLNSRP